MDFCLVGDLDHRDDHIGNLFLLTVISITPLKHLRAESVRLAKILVEVQRHLLTEACVRCIELARRATATGLRLLHAAI